MKTEFEYIPETGVRINSTTIHWDLKREDVRKIMDYAFKDADRVIDLGNDQSLQSKRDIYENINAEENYFFFNYNENNYLTEIEVHWGVDILVKNITLSFDKEINESIQKLKTITETLFMFT